MKKQGDVLESLGYRPLSDQPTVFQLADPVFGVCYRICISGGEPFGWLWTGSWSVRPEFMAECQGSVEETHRQLVKAAVELYRQRAHARTT